MTNNANATAIREHKGRNLTEYPTNYTIVDLETTGGSYVNDSIIEIGAIKVRDGKPVDEYSQLIKPKTPINGFITSLTGITNEMVANAPTIEEQLPVFLDFVGNDIIVGHNVNQFDINFLYEKCMAVLGKPFCNDFVDTLILSRRVYPKLENHKLETLVKALELEDGTHHRALADCYHTYRLLNAMQNNPNHDLIYTEESKPKKKKTYNPLSDTTKALNTLQGIIYGIMCDNVLTEDEVVSLSSWLGKHKDLAGNYPFDVLYAEIGKALEDNIIEEHELKHLKTILQETMDPIAEKSESYDELEFDGAIVCLSGEFVSGSKQEITEILTEKGAVVKDTVTRHTDILVVGGCGNSNWACGNYGNKVKKALELQAKGSHIKIIKETDINM